MKALWVFTLDIPRAMKRGIFPFSAKTLPELPAVGEVARSTSPRVEVEFAKEDFEDDYSQWHGITLVSEKMRRAMALGPTDIQYFDVDTSQAPPLPRSKHYQLMHVPVTEDMSDPERSDYTFRHRPDGIELCSPAHAIAFRADAEPAHEIFYDRFFKVILCTDELALRVLWAGCTGVRFLDPANIDDVGSCYRTLRGVEEARAWDWERNDYAPGKLVREIP